jgi:hypothetical protein
MSKSLSKSLSLSISATSSWRKRLWIPACAVLLAVGCSDDDDNNDNNNNNNNNDTDLCAAVDCGDHGTCDLATGDCDCDTGYTGAICDSCATGYVDDGGTCVQGECVDGTACGDHEECDPVTHTCVCAEGYTDVEGTCVSNLVTDFEDLTLHPESHWIGDATGISTFETGDASMSVYWTDEYGFDLWEGIAYTNETDTTTPGSANQFSAMAGGGYGGNGIYATVYTMPFVLPAAELELHDGGGYSLAGMYVTNSTWAFLAMRDGDAYAKQFGGPDGTDPDWFLLTIEGLDENGSSTGTVEFYLADFRSSDQNEDYILDDWTWVDLSSLGDVVRLRFSLSSSDTGQYGMNTPAYFCFDQVLRFNPDA